ncbi:MAG: c-type cytochrome domain-containing protein [Myxococcota bacterium]
MRYGWIFAFAVGCDDNLFGVAEESTPSGLTGYAGVQALFESDCWACHGSAPAGNTLDLQTDLIAATVDVDSSYGVPFVVPGDPEGSALYLKLVADPAVGGVMPPGAPIADAEIEIVHQWIADGATQDAAR